MEVPRIPAKFTTSVWSYGLGLFLIALGLLWVGWVFIYRSPWGIFLSTYYTLKKGLTRADLSAPLGRSEPFVVDGPYLYVRNPIYFGACVLSFGFGFMSGFTFVLVASLGLCLWFNLVIIPFEEREMKALFGQDYVTYTRMVPSFLPSGKVVYGRSKRKLIP